MIISWSCAHPRLNNRAKEDSKFRIPWKLRKYKSLIKCRRLPERLHTPYNQTPFSKRRARRKTRIKMCNRTIRNRTTRFKNITLSAKTRRSSKKRMKNIIWHSMKMVVRSSNFKVRSLVPNNLRAKFWTRPRLSKLILSRVSTKSSVMHSKIPSKNLPKAWAYHSSQTSKRGLRAEETSIIPQKFSKLWATPNTRS